MSEFDERMEAMQAKLDKAIQANLEKYPGEKFDFSQKEPAVSSAFSDLASAVIAYAMNRLTELEVKPFFLVWVRAIRS